MIEHNIIIYIKGTGKDLVGGGVLLLLEASLHVGVHLADHGAALLRHRCAMQRAREPAPTGARGGSGGGRLSIRRAATPQTRCFRSVGRAEERSKGCSVAEREVEDAGRVAVGRWRTFEVEC